MIRRKTQIKRMFKDSGELNLVNTASISPSSVYVFQLDERFKPYDEATLFNYSETNDATIKINSRHSIPFPKKNQAILNGHNINTLFVINNGSTDIAIGEVKLSYRHTAKEGNQALDKAKSIISVGGSLKLLGGL